MVLETLTTPFKAEQHPGWLFLHGAAYATIGLILALYFFPEYASIVTVFFVSAAAIPLLYNIIKYEENKDYHELQESVLIKEHGKAVFAYFMLFVGVTMALAAAFVFMPAETIDNAFGAQIATYESINPSHKVVGQFAGTIAGNSVNLTGDATRMSFFTRIFLNNTRVLVFCILFSFLYGAGAIFILTWNASVLALAIGNAVRTQAAEFASSSGLVQLGAYLAFGAKTTFLRYGLHGSLEIIAYIIAGLAGGIISVAVIRHHYQTKQFEHIIIDSADLIMLSLAILFLAGLVEAFVTPIFY